MGRGKKVKLPTRYFAKDDEILFHVLAFLAALIYLYGHNLKDSRCLSNLKRDFSLRPGFRLQLWSPSTSGDEDTLFKNLPVIVTNLQTKDMSHKFISSCDSLVVIIHDVHQDLLNWRRSNQKKVGEKISNINQELATQWLSHHAALFGGDLERIKFL